MQHNPQDQHKFTILFNTPKISKTISHQLTTCNNFRGTFTKQIKNSIELLPQRSTIQSHKTNNNHACIEPKVCGVKYISEDLRDQARRNITQGFSKANKKYPQKNKQLKNNKQFNDVNLKNRSSIKKDNLSISPNGISSLARNNLGREIKIKFQTIYGAVETAFPKKKFFPKLYDRQKQRSSFQRKIHKNQQSIFNKTLNNNTKAIINTRILHNTKIVNDKNNKATIDIETAPYLKISNHQIISNARHFQQLQRLRMSLQNRKIEEKRRSMGASGELTVLILMNQKQKKDNERVYSSLNAKKSSISHQKKEKKSIQQIPQIKYFNRGVMNMPDRYSPWENQKTQHELEYVELNQQQYG